MSLCRPSNRTSSLSELKTLPAEQHLFCPRVDRDDPDIFFDEDIANIETDDSPAAVKEREAKISEAENRKWVTLEALQILAFDGEDAAPHKAWVVERLDALMTTCDVCVRVFHKSRAEWRAKLME